MRDVRLRLWRLAFDCAQNACYNRHFRSMDGSCNNEHGALLNGAAFPPYLRLRPPEYDNGLSTPIGNRPSARDASRLLLSSGKELTSANSAMMMQWGQFLSHDIVHTTHVNDVCDCQTRNGGSADDRCFPITTNFQDPTFSSSGCLIFQRSTATCGTGGGGSSVAREQYNQNTAFIDGSAIYGSSTDDLSNFRVATRLQVINPQWDGDRLFQTTRLIIGAQMQAITYKEFLPKLLGSSFDTRIGPYAGYQAATRPDMANVFASCAFRFGHGMIQEFYPLLDQNYQQFGGINFAEGVLGTEKLLNQGIDSILRGLMATAAKLPQRLTTTITERLFGNTDLAAKNIQRGRDHGLGGYNDWREFCGLTRAHTFQDFSAEISDPGVRANMEQLYGHPDRVDMYVGALMEEPTAGGLIGPSLGCIIGDQFKRTRDGDRFYFENSDVFSEGQLTELRKATLSRLLCDSGDAFFTAPVDAFLLTTPADVVECQQLPVIDLDQWRE